MPILRDPVIDLDAEKVALGLNRGRANEGVTKAVAEALERGRPLWRPQAVYEYLEVVSVSGPEVTLRRSEDGLEEVLKIGSKADLMAPAELALAAVQTLGPDLEEEVNRLQKEGRNLEAYYLDGIGVTALGEVAQAIRHLVEEEAAQRGWGVGYGLAPGSLLGWPVSGQAKLVSLLDLEEIGVHLNKSGLLVPLKSSSSLIGLGRDYESGLVGSVCRWCAIRETCWRRREDSS